MAVLGDDGRGYELARKLETCGVWRWWLGESLYANFVPSLSSPSSWDSFMSADDSKSRAQICLQLRARALLFDKASVSLYLPPDSLSSSSIVSNLTPSYLQLHGDDVYFTLEDGAPQPLRDGGPSKVQSQRFKQEDFPQTWYNQFLENYRASKPYIFSFANRESERRKPNEMCNYLRLVERHKRRKIELNEDDYGGLGSSNSENTMQPSTVLGGDTTTDTDSCFFPETMFMMNCVPDRAIAPRLVEDEGQKVEFFGVLDKLPQVATKSSIMLERLGIRPEHLSVEQGPGRLSRGHVKVGSNGNRKQLSQEQAVQMSKKVVACVLTSVGFEGASEIPIEVLSQFLSCHVSKLGRILKVLTDSYRKQCSATELLKMFLQTSGNINLAALAEHVKDNRNIVQPSGQQNQNMQPQLPLPQQNTLQLPQQTPRQMHSQMPHTLHPQNPLQQQQQHVERMRRRQVSSPRPVMSIDKDRPMVEVKLEKPPDLPMDSNTLSAVNYRLVPTQWQQQQQFASLQRIVGSSGNQMRQPTPMQMPLMQSPNIGALRAPPVKVEGFQELMGGNTSLKQNSDDSRLSSPSK